MLTSALWRSVVSLVLVASFFLATLPVSAADLSKPLGSVSTVGDVSLRGIPVRQAGTFFSGDQIRTGKNSYAKVAFNNTNTVELLNESSGIVTNATDRLTLNLQTGRLAFAAAKEPVAITLGNYEVISAAGTTGNVALVGPELAGVRVIKGSVTVRNIKTNRSATVGVDDVQVINLKTDEMHLPADQLVRALPSKALPPAGTSQAPKGGGGVCRGPWIPCHPLEAALIFGAAGAAVVGVLVVGSPKK